MFGCTLQFQRRFIMIGQRKISSFFAAQSQKRSNSENVTKETNDNCKIQTQSMETTPKKARLDELENQDPTSPRTTPPSTPQDKGENASVMSEGLSPEQRQKMAENKFNAKMKLMATKTEGLVINFGRSWFKALETEFEKPYFVQLAKFVASERQRHTIYPPPHQVFSFTQVCELKKVKVVILGQDPYHGPKQAHGLCFSVQKGIRPPPSLENMFKELITDIEGFKHPGHGDLTGWAEQGVLLLNACLTVRASQANSHKDHGWEKFTDAVVGWLNRNQAGLVFMLWGSYAQKKGASIDKKKHHVLKGVHPSPLSAHRGYFGCKHFSQANKLLKDQGKKPIDWTHLPEY